MRCEVFIACSLDGYIARRDGGIDWLRMVEVPGEDYGYGAFIAGIDVLVIGRGTYDKVMTFPEWPYGDKRVIVLTHRPIEGRETFAGDVRDLELGDARVYVDGGQVIAQFLAAGLIHQLRVAIIPVILGDGLRLFPGGEGEHRLELVEQRAWPSGLVQLRYSTACSRASP